MGLKKCYLTKHRIETDRLRESIKHTVHPDLMVEYLILNREVLDDLLTFIDLPINKAKTEEHILMIQQQNN